MIHDAYPYVKARIVFVMVLLLVPVMTTLLSRANLARAASNNLGETMVLSQYSGAPGDIVTVTGSGFWPDAVVSASFDNNTPFVTVTADSSGNVNFTFIVPLLSGVSHTFYIVSKNTCVSVASATITDVGWNCGFYDFAFPFSLVASDTTKPGGTWITPDNNFTIADDIVHFKVHAHDNSGGSGVKYVNFTALYGGSWHTVDTEYSANGGGDIYYFDWNVSALPAGALTVSFDVYDNQGNQNLAPNGTHSGTIQRQSQFRQVKPLTQHVSGAYDDSTLTLDAEGCAVASSAMVLLAYGITTLPDGSTVTVQNLNSWLKAHNGFDALHELYWGQVVAATKGSSQPLTLPPGSVSNATSNWAAEVKQDLDNRQPVIIGFTWTDGMHFVVATSYNSNGIQINDPDGRFNTAQDYTSQGYVVTELVHFVPASASSSQIASLESTSSQSLIEIQASASASVTVTDSQGRQESFGPGATPISQIPSASIVFQSSLLNDTNESVSGELGGDEYLIVISSPPNDSYTIQASAPSGISYALGVLTLDESANPTVSNEQLTSNGQPQTQIIHYNSTPPSTAPIQASQPATAKDGCTYFPQTQHNLCGGFSAYWNKFGGLAVFGYPMTEEFQENGVTTQYFERARFEWHPGAWPSHFDVELGLLGDEIVSARYGSPPSTGSAAFRSVAQSISANCIYFPQTQQNLCNGFLDYWQNNGGLAIFGMPISQEFNEDGRTVQYFERERFEYHPEFAGTPYTVLLGRLGAQVLEPSAQASQPSQPASTILEQDNFDDPAHGIFPSAQAANYQNGKYVYSIGNADYGWAPFGGNVANTQIDISGQVTTNAVGESLILICRYTPTDAAPTGYQFWFNPSDGSYQLARQDAHAWIVLDSGTAPTVNLGSGTNLLSLRCEGSTITAWVNSVQVATMIDSTYGSGQEAFGVGGRNVVAAFDNLVVYQR